MKLASFAPIAAAIAMAVSTAGAAAWTHTVKHSFTGKTSIKVTEPKGFKVHVTVGNEVKEDTIPAIFSLPDADAFMSVKIVASDGSAWSEKIEVKHKHQTELTAVYAAEAKAQPQGPGRSYIGKLGSFVGRCGTKWKGEVQYEFIRASDGAKGGTVQLPQGDGTMKTLELANGAYDVRVSWRKDAAAAYAYIGTEKINVAQDNWVFAWGCRNGGEKPGRVTAQ